ncbi:hypothetical protein L208DRAFT_1392646 [Tricholoma matsutake]|nr:hypothetical protein L208DRAFT_1392646 [Tricholoma matsutake 945]
MLFGEADFQTEPKKVDSGNNRDVQARDGANGSRVEGAAAVAVALVLHFRMARPRANVASK